MICVFHLGPAGESSHEPEYVAQNQVDGHGVAGAVGTRCWKASWSCFLLFLQAGWKAL